MNNYNGWTNWDTWNANLHITNDEMSYRIAKRINRQELPVFFEDNFVHCNEFKDYDGINLNNVNWNEIYEGLQQC